MLPEYLESPEFRPMVRRLLRAREETLPGSQSNIADIGAIVRSHHRLTQKDLNPDRGARIRTLSLAKLEQRRRESHLTDLIQALRQDLHGGDHLRVTTVHDSAGWVLWRFGSAKALHIADSLGLVVGANWGEDAVGTNAAGNALIERRGLRCVAHEHYVASHQPFACTATPLYDAWDQRLLGVLNATTLARMAHPDTLPMLETAARRAEDKAREMHKNTFAPLRKAARLTLDRLGTPAVVTDRCGHVIESQKLACKYQLLPLPTQVSGQPFECSRLGGWWVLEPLGSGWLWRPAGAAPTATTRVELDVRQLTLTVHGPGASMRYDLTSKKYIETLFLLAWTRAGRHATELAEDLYGDSTKKNTVRPLFWRMRQEFGHELFHSDPYRFREHLDVRLNRPDSRAELLPFSTAPAICRIRARVP